MNLGTYSGEFPNYQIKEEKIILKIIGLPERDWWSCVKD